MAILVAYSTHTDSLAGPGPLLDTWICYDVSCYIPAYTLL